MGHTTAGAAQATERTPTRRRPTSSKGGRRLSLYRAISRTHNVLTRAACCIGPHSGKGKNPLVEDIVTIRSDELEALRKIVAAVERAQYFQTAHGWVEALDAVWTALGAYYQ